MAGILGMNVSDVRNMEQKQWIFWAIAIPLTIIIISLCLLWAGELRNFLKGFQNLWSGRAEVRRPVMKRTGRSELYGPARPTVITVESGENDLRIREKETVHW